MAVFTSDGGITASLLWGIWWTAITLTGLSTAVRSIVHLRRHGRFAADDYLVVFAWILLFIMGVLYSININFLCDIYIWSQTRQPVTPALLQSIRFFLRCQFVLILLFWTVLWSVKFAFLMNYKPLFDGLGGLTKKLWWAVMAFTSLAYIGSLTTGFTACQPLSGFFDATCMSSEKSGTALSLHFSTAVDVLSDLFSNMKGIVGCRVIADGLLVMALPLKLLYGLAINWRQKCGLVALFSLGWVIIVFAIVRVVSTPTAGQVVDTIRLAMWTMLEASIAITVVSLPPLRVFFITKSSRTPSTSTSTSTSSSSSHSPTSPHAHQASNTTFEHSLPCLKISLDLDDAPTLYFPHPDYDHDHDRTIQCSVCTTLSQSQALVAWMWRRQSWDWDVRDLLPMTIPEEAVLRGRV